METEYQTREQRRHASESTYIRQDGLSGPVGLRGRVANVANRFEDQQKVIALLSQIYISDGGMKEQWAVPPLAGPSGSCPRFLADAIWTFQTVWKSRGMFRNIDGVVDPGGNTLRKMQQLILGGTPEYDPKSLAEWSKGLATRWCNIAMSAIRRYQLADPGELDLWRRQLMETALDTHFQISAVNADKHSDLLEIIHGNYFEAVMTMNASGSIFMSASAADHETDRPGQDLVPAYTSYRRYIKFTPDFKPWYNVDQTGYGELSRAAMVVHECIHYVDQNAPDHAYEWDDINYNSMLVEQAIHNP